MNTRALAAKIVTEVFVEGRSLNDVLDERQSQVANVKDTALLQEFSYGVCRWWWRYDAILNQLLEKPLKQKDSDLKHLLMVGLHQLTELRIPDHAAVAETVNACNDLNKSWATKLVNALLRNYQRKCRDLKKTLEANLSYQYSHPQWLVGKIQKAWPDHWQSVLQANNQKPPMVLRVNQTKTDRDEYNKQLAVREIFATEFKYSDEGLVLESAMSVNQLPEFETGWVSVQDGAAQLAAGLLALDGADQVLDVCAAPGGKAAHILETASQDVYLTALDIDRQRLQKVSDNMARLGLNASLLAGDAQRPEQWWNQQAFDRILVDAPCSATGVIRRHPDIKQLRRPADIQQLVSLQAHILNAVWPLLSSGGMLLYATCSILPEENDRQVGSFLEVHKDAKLMDIEAAWGIKQKHGRQILPGQDDMDGFYYACLQKH